MNLFPRYAPLAFLFLAAPLIAQSPADRPQKPAPATTPTPNPATKRVPPEIAPASPEPTDKGEKKPVEVSTTSDSLSPGAQAPAERAKSTGRSLLDSLSGGDLDKILPILKAHYLQPGSLSDTEIKRATVQGLLDRLNPKVSFITPSTAKGQETSPFRSEILESRLGYLRLGSVDDEHLAQLDAALKLFGEKGLAAVILDLRATPPEANFDLAADVCRRFCPKGKILFTVRQPNTKDQIFTSHEEPLTHEILVVLTDTATAGNGEIIAGVLRSLVPAMVIGQKTKGEAAGFEDLPISSSAALRVPVAEFVLPGSTASMVSGLEPDLSVEVSAHETKSLLQSELEKGAAPLVLEVERPRMNEAALVAGANPDLDAMIAAKTSHGEESKPRLRDLVLQRALDFVTSITIYRKGAHGEQ